MDAHAAAPALAAAVHVEVPGTRVVTVAHREAFLDALAAERWSLVVVSFDSSAYPGLEALRDAAHFSAAPRIGVGSWPQPDAVAQALRSGAQDLVARTRMDLFAARVAALLKGEPSFPEEQLAATADDARAALPEREAVLVLDRQWRVIDCSSGVTDVLGHGPADLLGQPLEVLFAGVPSADEFLARLRDCSDHAVHGDSVWMLRRDGLQMWAEVSCVADLAADGEPRQFRLTLRDATLHYRATQSVRHQADSAVAAAAGRNLFLGSIAHELRGALSPITTSAAVLERGASGVAQQERLVGIIRRNATSAARLVEDLLTFSTASENKLLMRHGEVDLHQLVADCTEAAQQHAAAGKVRLQFDADAAPGAARIECDADRIRQVVVNLIGNALKFTPPGGAVRVRIAGGPAGVDIEVSDNGAGIDPATLPFIFEPFEQGGTDITASYGGFGLGLAICAAIAKQHGGSISAASAGRGHGATFRLSLPRDTGDAAVADHASRDRKALHVLYVEDNHDAADAMRYALTKLGWKMTHAPSCASARELVLDGDLPFDVILADLGLPDGSGLDLGRELCRYLPVVALTAYGAPLGMEGFVSQLIKPAEMTEVQRALLAAAAMHRKASVH